MSRLHSAWLTFALTLGLLLVFVGERLLGVGTARGVLDGLGAALVLAAGAARAVRALAPEPHRRTVERMMLFLAGTGALGLLAYFAQSDLLLALGSPRLGETSPRLALVLSALCPLLLGLALIPTVLGEMAYASVARAPRMEVGRIRDAVLSGLGLVAALTFAFAASYVLSADDHTWDFSYFRTAKAGDATRKLIRNLDAPLEVLLFFPPGNDVQLEVAEYFRGLEGESSRLQIGSYDAALDVTKAKELNLVGNGAIILRSGQRKETITISVDLDRARADLRKLDKEVQDRLFALTRPHRTVYLTTGHGERSTDRPGGVDLRGRVLSFRKLLEALNQDVKNLSAAEGLATEIPADAGAVLVIGPTAALLPEETSALARYFARGGRLLIAQDPDSAADLSPLLAPTLGLNVEKTTLVNDRFYVPHTHTPSDRALIVTASFSSHPAVTTLSQAQGRYPLVFPVAGYLEESKQKPVQVSIDYSVRSHPTTFADLNGNYSFDAPAEVRKAWPIAAAVSRRTFGKPGEKAIDSRAMVIADSDCLSDGVVENPGNTYFAADVVKWLIGEEAVAGATNQETDVKIEHTRGRDFAYFYLTILGVPALVLGAGVIGTRRRRKRRAS